ncbi:amidohydrolase [Salinarimonas ramus]|uniref:Amidohydrolase n=1 Tax=Salinarimonas ramus TaxID=690164 RepID=A0A917V434_9HYPH|nr:amidohydrolase [Salinarimonas ramus]GGK34834.1 amidohydrolase [Salinarimonas ramus]
MRDAPTLILTNGRVFAGLGEGVHEAIAIAGNRVLAVGTTGEIAALAGPATRRIDLAGRLATPGLIDAHMHLLPLGMTMVELDLTPQAAPTLEALLKRIAARAAELPKGAWILARGYDQARLDVGRHPTRDELDRAAPDHPAYVVRACGHVAICNSAALALAGLDETSVAPQGGLIETDARGRLTGLLAETARDPVRAAIPAPTREELVAAIERAGRACLAHGIVGVMDAAVGMRAGLAELDAYDAAHAAGRLPVRVSQCLLGGPGGIAEAAYDAGWRPGRGDTRLMAKQVKIFTDGSAGGRTAAMTQPYLGTPETRGLLSLTDAEMRDHTRRYHEQGWQLAVHAIGDAAIDQTLDAMEAALAGAPDPDRRHRIEHCGFVRPDQTARMARLRIEPVPQPVFLHDFGDLYVEVLGEARAAPSYPTRTWIEAGLHPAASSDAPVCALDPRLSLEAMITRRTRTGRVLDEGERVSPEVALAAFTEYGAFVEKEEAARGRLAPGMLADIAVFTHDFLAEPDRVRDTACTMAIVDGAIAHEAA